METDRLGSAGQIGVELKLCAELEAGARPAATAPGRAGHWCRDLNVCRFSRGHAPVQPDGQRELEVRQR